MLLMSARPLLLLSPFPFFNRVLGVLLSYPPRPSRERFIAQLTSPSDYTHLCSRCAVPYLILCSSSPRANRALQRPFQTRDSAMQRKLISKKELKSVYGIPYCFAHIARLEAAGQFPKRVVLGACRVAWVAEEVEAWIEERVSNRALTFPS